MQNEPVTEEQPAEAEAPAEAATPPLEAATWKPDAKELPAELTPAVPGPESVGEAAAPSADVGPEGVDGTGLSETAPAAESAEAANTKPAPKGDGEETEEPKPILLWRPARFEQRPRHHRQDNRQRRGQRDGAAAADGKAQDDRTRRDGDRPQRSDVRPPRENGGKERFERGKFRGKPNADGQRPDRRDNRPGDKGGFQGKQPFQARPPREERPVRVDPEFAFRQARGAARPAQEVDGRRRPAAHRQMAVLRARGQVTLAGRQTGGRGRVRINGDKAGQASDSVKQGDVLTITLERQILVYKVLPPGSRRGPADEARTLYEDLSPPPAPKGEAPPDALPPLREAGSGRPTKKERRETDRLRNGGNKHPPHRQAGRGEIAFRQEAPAGNGRPCNSPVKAIPHRPY